MAATIDARKVAAARIWAATKLPYLASAVFGMEVVPKEGCGTIAAERSWCLYAEPDVVERFDAEGLGKLMLHLAAHLLREHASRAESLRIAETDRRAQWNRATDAEINDDLHRDGCVPGAAPDLPVDLEMADGQLAEAYLEHGANGPRHWDCGSGCDDCERPWDTPGKGLGPQQAELLRLGVAEEIQRQSTREPGSVPGGWLRWAERTLPSRVDWRRILAAEIRRGVASVAGKVDYTYRRPSGSMHDGLLARVLAEVEGLLQRGGLRQTQMRVLAVDTNVHAVRRVTKASQVVLAGGGGTDMGSGISAAAALKPRPSVIVVLTDGMTPWPERPPKGLRVIVGLLEQGALLGGMPARHGPPAWATTVRIDEVGGQVPLS